VFPRSGFTLRAPACHDFGLRPRFLGFPNRGCAIHFLRFERRDRVAAQAKREEKLVLNKFIDCHVLAILDSCESRAPPSARGGPGLPPVWFWLRRASAPRAFVRLAMTGPQLAARRRAHCLLILSLRLSFVFSLDLLSSVNSRRSVAWDANAGLMVSQAQNTSSPSLSYSRRTIFTCAYGPRRNVYRIDQAAELGQMASPPLVDFSCSDAVERGHRFQLTTP
jgi:hypothetical protein